MRIRTKAVRGLRDRALLIGLLVGLSGCGTFAVDRFLQESVQGTDFTSHLAREYQRRTDVEKRTDKEWVHAGRLAAKGYRALDGEAVEPWVPSEWNVHPKDLGDLEAARERLIGALETGRAANPEACARAQVYYDGWLEQAHDNDFGKKFRGPVQPDFVAAERAAFEEMLPLCAGIDEEDALTDQQFVIYFEWDKYVLTDAARAVLAEMTAFIDDLGRAEVDIVGHTDTSGSKKYNLALSERRAKAVADALTDTGVPNTDVTFYGRGETALAVPTDDGVRNELNRRAEVVIRKAADEPEPR